MSARFFSRNRLRITADIQHVLRCRHNKAIHGRHFKLIWSKSEQDNARLCVITSKKSAKKAVIRNLLRRISKESFRHSGIAHHPVDIVIIAKKHQVGVCQKELRSCVDTLLTKCERLVACQSA